MITNETPFHKRPNDKDIDIGQRTAVNNEQSPNRIFSYKRPRNHKCKTIQTRKLTACLCTKK